MQIFDLGKCLLPICKYWGIDQHSRSCSCSCRGSKFCCFFPPKSKSRLHPKLSQIPLWKSLIANHCRGQRGEADRSGYLESDDFLLILLCFFCIDLLGEPFSSSSLPLSSSLLLWPYLPQNCSSTMWSIPPAPASIVRWQGDIIGIVSISQDSLLAATWHVLEEPLVIGGIWITVFTLSISTWTGAGSVGVESAHETDGVQHMYLRDDAKRAQRVELVVWPILCFCDIACNECQCSWVIYDGSMAREASALEISW